MKLEEYKTPKLDPNQNFRYKNLTLNYEIIDFWRWNQSDLVENRNRGILAEFIVKEGLKIDSNTRLEWDEYDLITEGNTKIEVKSSAYVQAWKQSSYSKITFNISKRKSILPDNNFSNESYRQADVYIFCLLHHKDQSSIQPWDLSQWTFYLVKKQVLGKELGDQKTIGLSSINNIEHIKCNYLELNDRFFEIEKSL